MSMTLIAPEMNKGLRTMRWHAVEHAFYDDVSIDIWPVHPLSIPDKLKLCLLRGCRFRQPPGPRKRQTDSEIERSLVRGARRSPLLVEAIDILALVQLLNEAHVNKILRVGSFCLGVRLRQRL